MFEQQNIAFGYFLRPDAAPEERVYQEVPASAAQLAPLLENYLDTYNTRFNSNLNLGTWLFLGLCHLNTLLMMLTSMAAHGMFHMLALLFVCSWSCCLLLVILSHCLLSCNGNTLV